MAFWGMRAHLEACFISSRSGSPPDPQKCWMLCDDTAKEPLLCCYFCKKDLLRVGVALEYQVV